MNEKHKTHWLNHPKAREACSIEYELVQGFISNSKENWQKLDDLRDEIDKDLTSKQPII